MKEISIKEVIKKVWELSNSDEYFDWFTDTIKLIKWLEAKLNE